MSSKYMIQIGEYQFSRFNSPTSWSFTEAEYWTEERVINGPPVSQHQGRGLFKISMEFVIDVFYNKDPEKTALNLLDLKRSGTPVRLFQGNGTHWGKVTIRDFGYSIVESKNGVPTRIECNITVHEYANEKTE